MNITLPPCRGGADDGAAHGRDARARAGGHAQAAGAGRRAPSTWSTCASTTSSSTTPHSQRLNYRDGDNYTFQPHLFRALLADAGPPGADAPVTIRTLPSRTAAASARARRRARPALPLKLWFVNLVQTVSFLHTAETGGQLSPEVMTEFYTQERFPEVITANPATRKLPRPRRKHPDATVPHRVRRRRLAGRDGLITYLTIPLN